MYCPQCLTEYREGFVECADCRAPLAPGLPSKPSPVEEIELVTVLETHDTFALSLAKASLGEAGIEYLVKSNQLQYLRAPQEFTGLGVTPLGGCYCQIQVAREFESEARALLEPLRNPVPTGEIEVDSQD